jgi:hypothetical protein
MLPVTTLHNSEKESIVVMFKHPSEWFEGQNGIRTVKDSQRSEMKTNPRDPEVIQRNFKVTQTMFGARSYAAKFGDGREVMRETASGLSTRNNDSATVRSMVAVAQARGWRTVELRGSEAFRRKAWIHATANGMRTTGYRPLQIDRIDLGRFLQQERKHAPQVQASHAAHPARRQTEIAPVSRETRAQAVAAQPRQKMSPAEIAAAVKQVNAAQRTHGQRLAM